MSLLIRLKIRHTYRIFSYEQLETLLEKFIISIHQWFKSIGIYDNINEPLNSWDKKLRYSTKISNLIARERSVAINRDEKILFTRMIDCPFEKIICYFLIHSLQKNRLLSVT